MTAPLPYLRSTFRGLPAGANSVPAVTNLCALAVVVCNTGGKQQHVSGRQPALVITCGHCFGMLWAHLLSGALVSGALSRLTSAGG